MSPSSGPESTPELCEQCRVLFSASGLRDLMSSKAWFKHSPLASFEHRTGCRFCRFLWEEDLMGADNLPRRFRRLRDLVYPPPGTARLQNAKNLVGSWVAISCLELGTGALGGQLDYLTALATASDDSAATALRGGMRIFVRVENSTGRMFWDFPHLRGCAAQGTSIRSQVLGSVKSTADIYDLSGLDRRPMCCSDLFSTVGMERYEP